MRMVERIFHCHEREGGIVGRFGGQRQVSKSYAVNEGGISSELTEVDSGFPQGTL